MEASPPQPIRIDWVYPHPDVRETVLWGALHDSEITSVESDTARTNVSMSFSSRHLSGFLGCDQDLRFVFRFEGIRSLRAIGPVDPAGELIIPSNATQEDALELLNEFNRRSHMESLAWPALEAKIQSFHSNVLDARFLRADGKCAMKLTAIIDYDDWTEIYITAEGFSVSRSDGVACDLDKFMAMGEAYWENWATKHGRSLEKDAEE